MDCVLFINFLFNWNFSSDFKVKTFNLLRFYGVFDSKDYVKIFSVAIKQFWKSTLFYNLLCLNDRLSLRPSVHNAMENIFEKSIQYTNYLVCQSIGHSIKDISIFLDFCDFLLFFYPSYSFYFLWAFHICSKITLSICPVIIYFDSLLMNVFILILKLK